MTDKQTPTDAATPECLTCSDHGAVGNSGFDHKTAAYFLSGKTVSDEALRKFVVASRGAHDARAALHAKMLSLQGELASREAEIALLKRSLLDAEADAAAPQHSTTAQSADSVPAVEREQERIAFKDAHRHLELDEVPDAWGRPMFKHSHIEASWLGWIARAARAPADSVLEDAARYRWLRDSTIIDGAINDELYVHVDSSAYPGRWALTGTELDGAVDAARKQGEKQ